MKTMLLVESRSKNLLCSTKRQEVILLVSANNLPLIKQLLPGSILSLSQEKLTAFRR
jgi:hypothetical protein